MAKSSLSGAQVIANLREVPEYLRRYAIPHRGDGSVLLPVWVSCLAKYTPANVFHEVCAWCINPP